MAVPLRRLSDLLSEMNFVEVQVRVFQEIGQAHRTRNLQLRIAARHRRLDELERRLRLRARELGHDDEVALHELRRRLAALPHHHTQPERRTPATHRLL